LPFELSPRVPMASLAMDGAPAAARSARRGELPARGGIGLKAEHVREVLETHPPVGFLEIHAENYMGDGGPPHHRLNLLRESYPLSIHGVGLSIGGDDALDTVHLERLARLVDRYQPEAVSEHLAWSSHEGIYFNDLLPIAYTTRTLHRVVAHIDQVQEHLGRRMLLENPSTYVAFAASTWDEVEFLAEIVRRTGCGLLLDVTNVQVSCINHGRDPIAYLRAVPARAIRQIHLAGYSEDLDGAEARLLIDAHGAPIESDVWRLYDQLLSRTGPMPTLIEWDNDVPVLATLLAQAARADLRLGTLGDPRLEAQQ